MQNYQEMLRQRHHAFTKANNILQAAENANREMTKEEELEFSTNMTVVKTLDPKLNEIRAKGTIFNLLDKNGRLIPGAPGAVAGAGVGQFQKLTGKVLSVDYGQAFADYVASGGKKMEAALYEGSDSAGGYAVPLTVDSQIVPLAPQEMGVRKLATVIPTSMDIKVPRGTAFSTAAAKAESSAVSGPGANAFTESEPTLDQFTLSAFMAGLQHIISWELAQDVPSFQAFAVTDLTLAQQMFEENWYVNGNSTTEPQGLIGNTGAGVTDVAAGTDSFASELLDATFDVLGKLNAVYHPGAAWLMSRPTGVLLRKAQKQANLFVPVWTRVGEQDYLHGYPVEYSAYMPAVEAGNTPVLFGNFKLGYVIGDRGGSGINVKILDQPLATQGQIILLAYRRTDGRVRRSEAIQAITLASGS